MTGPPLDDRELEDALRDLGAHLDPGPGGTTVGRAELVQRVIDTIDTIDTIDATDVEDHRRQRRRHLTRRRPTPLVARALVAATVAVAVLVALVAITPTRDAIARWLGVGGIGITTSDEVRPDGVAPAPGDVDGPTGTGSVSANALDDLRASVPFVVRLADPDLTGELRAATLDPSVPSGLVELRYDSVTVVELASAPGATTVLEKVLGPGTTATPVTVEGRPGTWLSGDVHEIASIGPDGVVQTDTVRRAGDVLVWENGGVTYRIEGAESLDAALAVAASLR